MKIYCFGNRLVKNDKTALEIIPFLQKKFPKLEFIEATTDDIEGISELVIIDVADMIDKVTVFTEKEIDILCGSRSCSLHDFDLGMTLKILNKMGQIKKLRIIGIPMNYEKEKAEKEVEERLKEVLEENKTNEKQSGRYKKTGKNIRRETKSEKTKSKKTRKK